MVNWFFSGEKPEAYPDCQKEDDNMVEAIRIRKNGKIDLYSRSPYPIHIREKQYAIGNGAPYARAAMMCGKNAEFAVKVASKMCPDCGLGMDVIKL